MTGEESTQTQGQLERSLEDPSRHPSYSPSNCPPHSQPNSQSDDLTEASIRSKTRALLIRGVKLVALGALVYWAYRRGLIEESLGALSALEIIDALGALIALGVTMIFGVIRWRWVLRALGLVEPSTRLGLNLYYQGLFYNTFTPGALGGDVLRAHWLRAHDASGSKLHYLVTLGERGLGLASLGALGAYAMFGLWGGLGYIVLGVASLLALPRVHAQVRHVQPKWLIAAVTLNLLSHLVSFCIYLSLARSLSITLPLDVWLQALTLTVLAANLPISVGGFGPREVTLITMLGAYGVSESTATALSLGAFAALITHALLGGAVHLLSDSREREVKANTEGIEAEHMSRTPL